MKPDIDADRKVQNLPVYQNELQCYLLLLIIMDIKKIAWNLVLGKN